MCVMEVGQDMLNRSAARAGARRQQQIMNEMTGVQRDEFDRRMRYAAESDVRTGGLLDRQYADTSALEDRTFAEMLEQDRAGYDDQLGIGRAAFDTRMLADNGLITEGRRIRLEQNAISNAERDRQRGFQGQADDLAAALPGRIGFDAQRAAAIGATARRAAIADEAMTGPVAPGVKGLDPMTAAMIASETSRGQGEAATDARSAAAFSARGDAFAGAERDLGSFADALSSLTQRAQLSRASLGDELAVGSTERAQAGDRRDFAVSLGDRTADQRGRTEGNYRDAMRSTISGSAERLGDALGRFFDRSLGSEDTMTSGLIGSSNRYEGTRVQLGNYRMGNTTAYSPLGNLVGMINAAGQRAVSAMAGGG